VWWTVVLTVAAEFSVERRSGAGERSGEVDTSMEEYT
jgi:hypothetical protein